MERPVPVLAQTLIGAGVLFVAAVMAVGATKISSEAGYSGIGPNFLPWFVAAALAVFGGFMIWEARTGGFRNAEEASGAPTGDWKCFAWASAGLIANALLITTLGFIVSCTICFVLAARGLRLSEDKPATLVTTLKDAAMGFAIAAPVYWMFTKLLAINLPGLTGTGWL